MYDIPHTPHGTRPPSPLLTRLLTIMRRIVMNWAMLYVMISECYLIDDGCRGDLNSLSLRHLPN